MNVKNVSIYKIVACLTALFIFAFSMNYHSSIAKATNTNRTYCIYEPSTGSLIDTYELSSLSDYTVNSRQAIGNDDREPDFSKSGVVKLMTNGNFLGTGFVIDDHIIATAAHCTYNRGSDLVVDIDEILLFDSETEDVELTLLSDEISEVHIPQIYTTCVDSDQFKYDYALIYVEENLHDYVMFDLGTTLDNFTDFEHELFITGFPSKVKNQTANTYDDHIMYTGSGEVTYIYDETFKTNADSSGGNSGGPAYIVTEYNDQKYYTVIGIVVSEQTGSNPTYNRCNRITTDQLHFFKNNPYI